MSMRLPRDAEAHAFGCAGRRRNDRHLCVRGGASRERWRAQTLVDVGAAAPSCCHHPVQSSDEMLVCAAQALPATALAAARAAPGLLQRLVRGRAALWRADEGCRQAAGAFAAAAIARHPARRRRLARCRAPPAP